MFWRVVEPSKAHNQAVSLYQPTWMVGEDDHWLCYQSVSGASASSVYPACRALHAGFARLKNDDWGGASLCHPAYWQPSFEMSLCQCHPVQPGSVFVSHLIGAQFLMILLQT